MDKKIATSKLSTILFRSVVFIVVFSVLYIAYKAYSVYQSTSENISEIKKKWPEYRCKPHILPIAGLIGPEGTSGLQNGLECGMTFFKNAFLSFMTPFIRFFEKIVEVLVDLVNSVQNIRKMIHYLRSSIRVFLLDIANMFYAYAKKMSYLFNRFMETFSKIFLVFEDILYSLGYGMYTLASLWNSPVGGVARFFCFAPGTYVLMKSGDTKRVEEIKLGDVLEKGGRVLGVHAMSGSAISMCEYRKKHFISSEHMIFEEGRWIRVRSSKNSVFVNTSWETIYCLTTENGLICLDDKTICSDYMEIQEDEDMMYINHLILEELNYDNDVKIRLPEKSEKVWGFMPHTWIRKDNKEESRIDKLKIGDKLYGKGIVQGICKIDAKGVPLYWYNRIIGSGSLIVYDGQRNMWDFMCNVGAKISAKTPVLYHIFTSNGKIWAENEMFRDYDQNTNVTVNKKINLYCQKRLMA